MPYIIALDQGTTSSRAIIFDEKGRSVSEAHRPLPQYYPKPGWVEHDPEEILSTQLDALREAYEKSRISPREILGIGITNQRETSIIWEKATGKPVHRAIVWQCRRTAPRCEEIKALGMGDYIHQKTGLLIDAYFSGTKYQWILDQMPGLRRRAEEGRLLCGTVESYLIFRLTGGKSHVSDPSNLSRSMLFDIDRLDYDDELLRLMNLPRAMLPTPSPTAGKLGKMISFPGLEDLAGLPILASAGDQAAALFGQGCFEEGQIKNTYGTGCFTLMNLGEHSLRSHNGLLTSVAWQLGGRTFYALEGSVFNAGSSIQWLRDELGLIPSAPECDRLAETVPDAGGVYLVSAFTGLGAPHWDMYARGGILGITRGTTKAHIARAALEGIAYQTSDLLNTMRTDSGLPLPELRVDGGASVSNILMQLQADIANVTVDRPVNRETTAQGVAFLAGLEAGLWSLDDLAAMRTSDRIFSPAPTENTRRGYEGWRKAVERCKGWEEK